MAAKDCIAEIISAAGRQLTNDELDSLLSQLQRRVDAKRRARAGDDMDALVREAADEFAGEMTAAAKIEKRNAALNIKRRLEALDFVRTNFADNPALGLEAVLVGVNRPVKGARRSVAQEQNQLRNSYMGGLTADIERAGLWKPFVSGALDEDIAKSLWARNRSDPVPAGVVKEADQLAGIIAKWQEVARQDANRAGAWIKRLEGWIVRQSHDAYKIRAVPFETWKAEILPRLDAERTFDGADPESFLRGAYQGLASGVHLKAGGDATAFKGPGNLAKKMSAERVLHFKSAEDWFAYNQRFGTGSLREALMRGLELSAQSTGLMRRLGTNPEANFAAIADDLTRGISDPKGQAALAQSVRGKLRNQLRTVDGTTRIPVSQMGARISASTRAWNNMTKLGAALFSQISDLPIYASEMRYQGRRSMLTGIGEGVAILFKGRNRQEMAEIDGMIGVAMESLSGDVSTRFSLADDDLPGAISKGQQLFFRFNGMSWWTDTLRAGASRAMAHHLALVKGNAWEGLNGDLRRTLGLYGIDRERWDIIRSAVTKQADNREYVVADTILDLPDDPFKALIAGTGKRATALRVADLKREIADQLKSYYIDRATYAVVEPDQRTRAVMQQGTQPGTPVGEFLRYIGQFKSFSAAVMQKPMGREIYGRGANSLGEALRNGNGEMLGLAQLILWTTAFGYVAMSAKDLAKGRTPRDPLDKKTWLAAMVQGGGAGIYGDFLFGEVKNRFGGGLTGTLAGPTFGALDDLADLYGRARDGDDMAAQSFRFALSNTPGANLFYTRIALDYLVLYRIQESLSPGSLRRMERRIEKENGQQFLVRPSAAMN